jgi:hypothetical protein
MQAAEQAFGKRLRAAISSPGPPSAAAAGIRDPELPRPNGVAPAPPTVATPAAVREPAPAPPTLLSPAVRSSEPAGAPSTVLSPAVRRAEPAPSPPTVASPAVEAAPQEEPPREGMRLLPIAVAIGFVLLVLVYVLVG